jgi:ABC-type antimicrobial peptide transport system permease subunit
MTFVGMVSNQLIGFEGRKKECAVMLSTAMDRGRLSGILLREMLITAVTASVLGAAVSSIMILIIGRAATASSTLGDFDLKVNPVAMILFVVFLIVVFTGTALFPIRNLRKMKIAQQIKYE